MAYRYEKTRDRELNEQYAFLRRVSEGLYDSASGSTPLHDAVRRGWVESVQMLLDQALPQHGTYGFDVDYRVVGEDGAEERAADLARRIRKEIGGADALGCVDPMAPEIAEEICDAFKEFEELVGRVE